MVIKKAQYVSSSLSVVVMTFALSAFFGSNCFVTQKTLKEFCRLFHGVGFPVIIDSEEEAFE